MKNKKLSASQYLPSNNFPTEPINKLVMPFVRKFEEEIWVGKAIGTDIRCSIAYGHSGVAGKLNVITYVTNGYVLITICEISAPSKNWVSLIVPEYSDEPEMIIHRLSVNAAKAAVFLKHAIDNLVGLLEDDRVVVDVIATLK